MDDGDGYSDVIDVYVDVIDIDYGWVEQFGLAYDGYGEWSNVVYWTYSGEADCNYPEFYVFDFYAYDYYGDYDVVSVGYEYMY